MARTPRQIMETYLLEVGVKGRLDLIPEIAQPDMIDEANQAFGGPGGHDGLAAHIVGFCKNLDNPDITIQKIVADTNEVMAWWSFTGKHVGPWLGRTPTGNPVSGEVFSFFDLVDGKISRYRLWLHAQLDEAVHFDSAVAIGRKAGRKP